MIKRLLAVLLGASSAMSPLAAASEWNEGGLYVSPQESGAFVPLKVLKADDHGVHVRIYSNVYPTPPAKIDEATLFLAGPEDPQDAPMGIGHLPISYATFKEWGAVFVQSSSVAEDELEGYQMWLEAEGGYF